MAAFVDSFELDSVDDFDDISVVSALLKVSMIDFGPDECDETGASSDLTLLFEAIEDEEGEALSTSGVYCGGVGGKCRS